MKIDRDEARRIAGLAHLQFDDEALDTMAVEMTAILGYIDQLRDVATGPVAEVSPIATPLRPDVPHEPISREDAERNAPQWSDGFFIVPAVIGGGK